MNNRRRLVPRPGHRVGGHIVGYHPETGQPIVDHAGRLEIVSRERHCGGGRGYGNYPYNNFAGMAGPFADSRLVGDPRYPLAAMGMAGPLVGDPRFGFAGRRYGDPRFFGPRLRGTPRQIGERQLMNARALGMYYDDQDGCEAECEPEVVEDIPNKFRGQYLGFVSTGNVVAGTSVNIIANPQVLFKCVRFSIPDNIAGAFTIDDIKVGTASQNVINGSAPGLMFGHDATGGELILDTCQPGCQISIAVTNISAADQVFRAGMFGKAAI